jgi:hypothetical protein
MPRKAKTIVSILEKVSSFAPYLKKKNIIGKGMF